MKYFSTFSGVGGFELGIGERGECVGFSEVDKYAVQTYQKNFPNHKNYGDITRIIASDLPDFELLVGGFPCQAFSIAGKQLGFDDTRGILFFDVARILKEKRPRLVILENVKGLLSHDAGRTFKVIVTTLAELGYAVEWQVLNAKNHGVPQNRERVFIVGHLGGFAGRQVFPLIKTTETTDNRLEQANTESEIASTIRSRYGNGSGGHIAPTIRATQHKSGDNQPAIVQLNKAKHSNEQVYGVAQTLNTGMQQHTFTEDMHIRRLTPVECERLMGYPDGWTEGVSDTQRYKQCGNGVVSNVVRDVVKKLLN